MCGGFIRRDFDDSGQYFGEESVYLGEIQIEMRCVVFVLG